jgi:hypothetical protein
MCGRLAREEDASSRSTGHLLLRLGMAGTRYSGSSLNGAFQAARLLAWHVITVIDMSPALKPLFPKLLQLRLVADARGKTPLRPSPVIEFAEFAGRSCCWPAIPANEIANPDDIGVQTDLQACLRRHLSEMMDRIAKG